MIRFVAALCLGLFALTRPALAVDVHLLTTPKGITVWHVEDHTVPTIAVEFAFKGGSHADADWYAGITMLGTALMKEGTQQRDSAALEVALDDVGASVSFDDSRNHIYGSFSAFSAFAKVATLVTPATGSKQANLTQQKSKKRKNLNK